MEGALARSPTHPVTMVILFLPSCFFLSCYNIVLIIIIMLIMMIIIIIILLMDSVKS